MTIEELRALCNKKNSKATRHASPEHQIQVSCVNWFDLAHPGLLLYAIPNGGARNKVTGAMLKKEGVRKGVPDMFLAVARNGYHGLYIELKNGNKGVLSQDQKNISAHLRSQGYKVEVCRDFDSFKKVVDDYLSA